MHADPMHAPVDAVQKFYDAREAVTDAAGRFEVPGVLPPLYWPLVRRPQFHYFAPGYVAQGVVVPERQTWPRHQVVQMRRLRTREELLRKSRGYPSQIPEEKMKEFLGAINIERAMLGFKPEGTRQP